VTDLGIFAILLGVAGLLGGIVLVGIRRGPKD
jgi:hypothetical protein